MSDGVWIEIVGFAAACLTTSAFLPQALKIWRSGSARDVSLIMYLMMGVGSALWLAYGLLLGSPALIVANSSSTALVIWILVLKLRAHLRPARMAAVSITVGPDGAADQPASAALSPNLTEPGRETVA